MTNFIHQVFKVSINAPHFTVDGVTIEQFNEIISALNDTDEISLILIT